MDSQIEAETSAKISKVDIDAIAKGDLSSIAGTYQGQHDITFFTNEDNTGGMRKSDGEFKTDFKNFEKEGEVAVFYGDVAKYTVIPKGVVSPSSSGANFVKEWDDTSRDRVIVSGEGNNMFFLD